MKTLACNIIIVCTIAAVFSSCMSAFQTQQSAQTLPPKTLEVNAELGYGEAGIGGRYGILNYLDAGLSWRVNSYLIDESFASMGSVDIKLNFYQNKHFIFSTGLGIGIGSDYMAEKIYVEKTIKNEDDIKAPEFYGSPAGDILIPLYLSMHVSDDIIFYLNPFYIYRFDVTENRHVINNSNDNKFYPGISFGLTGGTAISPLKLNFGVTNIWYTVKDLQLQSNGINYSNKLDDFYPAFSFSFGASWEFDLADWKNRTKSTRPEKRRIKLF